MSNQEYLVWWTSQDDCENFGFGTTLHTLWSAPEYLKREMYSRYGRAGRGRLWIPNDVPVSEIEWNEDVAKRYSLDMCGGIVFHAKDLTWLQGADGVITDLAMNVITLNTDNIEDANATE